MVSETAFPQRRVRLRAISRPSQLAFGVALLAVVSGGFTYFAKEVQRRLGIHHAVANELAFEDGCLTGQVIGAIVDGERKRTELLAACERLGVPASAAIAVGDGANDLPMMQAAGLSVAYMAKPKVQAQADVAVEAPGLDRWLALLGS